MSSQKAVFMQSCQQDREGDSKPRRTKIVCTIGPATSTGDHIRRLILAGMDVARLNFSHGELDTHRETLRRIRETSGELGKAHRNPSGSWGAKIRVGELPLEKEELQTGERIILSPRTSRDPSVIPVNYPYIVEDVHIGERILIGGWTGLTEGRREEGRQGCSSRCGGVDPTRPNTTPVDLVMGGDSRLSGIFLRHI